MASVKKEDIPEISEFMKDFWVLVKEFWKPEKGVGYWEKFNEKATKIRNKYRSHAFVVFAICAYLEYLETKIGNSESDVWIHRIEYLESIGRTDEAEYWKHWKELREKEVT